MRQLHNTYRNVLRFDNYDYPSDILAKLDLKNYSGDSKFVNSFSSFIEDSSNEIKDHWRGLPGPLRDLVPFGLNKINLPDLLSAHGAIVKSNDEKWKSADISIALKSSVVLTGHFVVKHRFFEAYAMFMIVGFLVDLCPLISNEDVDFFVEAFSRGERIFLRQVFGSYYYHLDIVEESDNYKRMRCIAGVIGLLHPDQDMWLDCLASARVVTDYFVELTKIHAGFRHSWCEITIFDEEEGIKYKIDYHDTFSLGRLMAAYTVDCKEMSIKSCRKVHCNGRVLFLSVHGKRHLFSLGIKDGCVIKVGRGLNKNNEPDDRVSSTPKENYRKKEKKKQNGAKQVKKQKRKTKSRGLATRAPTMEDYRKEHSKSMGRVFDEAHDKFALIRKIINDRAVKNAPPKKRDTKTTPDEKKDGSIGGVVGCMGAKAGKIAYPVLVGEETDLYKSSKRRHLSIIGNASGSSKSKVTNLDLHGCSKEEALDRLNENLPRWVDKAMMGPPPFVIKANIICGGGNQVLADVVKEWIFSNKHVANRRSR